MQNSMKVHIKSLKSLNGCESKNKAGFLDEVQSTDCTEKGLIGYNLNGLPLINITVY